jgi:hypothetical protein
MVKEIKQSKGEEAIILFPKPELFEVFNRINSNKSEKSENSEQGSEKTDFANIDYHNTHRDPEVEARLATERTTGNEAKKRSQTPFSSRLTEGIPVLNSKSPKEEPPDPVGQIPHAEDIPGLRALLEEFLDVFPADLPAELPVEREFEMKIPIKPGSTPPNQAPYRMSESARDAVMATLEYLYGLS